MLRFTVLTMILMSLALSGHPVLGAGPDALGLQRGMLLEEAIALLERDGLRVFYSSDLIKPWSRVHETPTSQDPGAALLELLAPLGLTTQTGPDGALLVIRSPDTRPSPVPTGGIAGVVSDAGSRMPVAGAAVSVAGGNQRTVTAADGRFAFTNLRADRYQLVVRYPPNGFEATVDIAVDARQTAMAYVAIDTASATALEEVVVAASQYELTRAPGASHALLTGEDIEYLPDFGDDALRAVARLPGASSSGVSAQTNVRGGEVGETLIRFDGLRLYNPYHLKNFQTIFSTVDPRLVRSIDVYTGGFPASYGDRMSSVIDIASLDAPDDRYRELNLSFFNTSFLSAGRFNDGDEWVASVRRSNLDLLFDAHSSHRGKPTYMDAFAKITHTVSPGLTLSANYLYFADEIALMDADGSREAAADDDEHYLWLRADHKVGAALSGTTLLASSQLQKSRNGRLDESGVSRGSLSDERDISITTLQTDWRWQRNDHVLLRFGGNVHRSEARYDYVSDAEYDIVFDDPGTSQATLLNRDVHVAPSGYHYGAYATLRYSPTPRIATDFGARWDKQTLDPDHSDTLSPRVGIRYRLAERTYLRGSIGRFYQSQAVTELQVEDGIAEFFAPQRADHLVVGFEHSFPAGLGLRIEAYRKHMADLRPRFENLLNTLALLPELKPDRVRVAPNRADARGVEVLLSQQLSYPLTWWLAYSWSLVEDDIAGLTVPRSWDQRQALSAGLNWDTAKWNIGLGLLAHSGWPTTEVTLDDSGTVALAVPGPRNGKRLGDFRSFDFRVTRKFTFERSALNVFLEVSNALGRKNPCCNEFELLGDEEGGGLEIKTIDYLPRIPSLGFTWKF